MLTIDNLISNLFKYFPTFKEEFSYDYNELLPYNVIGDFTLYFQDKFLSSRLTSYEIANFFNFFNEMANSQDKEVQNIFVIEVLEILSDKEETIKIAREKLNSKGIEMLEKTLIGWK